MNLRGGPAWLICCLASGKARTAAAPGLARKPQKGPRALLVALVLLVPVLAAAQPLVLRDDRGATVTLAAPPARIVSLLPSLTETVCALRGCDRLVGVDRFSNWPAQVNALPRLGGLEDLQVESLLRLRPDVVLASVSHRMLDRLDALGVPVVALRTETHADVRRTFERVAVLLGEPRRAEEAWSQLQAQLEAAAARMPAHWRSARVYVEIGSGWAAGANSFIGQTLAALGLRNAVDEAFGPFPKLNPEHALRIRPDLFIASAHEAAALRARPGWLAIPALAAGRLCEFDAMRWELLVRPGPRLAEAAGSIVECLAALAPPAR